MVQVNDISNSPKSGFCISWTLKIIFCMFLENTVRKSMPKSYPNCEISRYFTVWARFGHRFANGVLQKHAKNKFYSPRYAKSWFWAVGNVIYLYHTKYLLIKMCLDGWKKLHKNVDTFWKLMIPWSRTLSADSGTITFEQKIEDFLQILIENP